MQQNNSDLASLVKKTIMIFFALAMLIFFTNVLITVLQYNDIPLIKAIGGFLSDLFLGA